MMRNKFHLIVITFVMIGLALTGAGCVREATEVQGVATNGDVSDEAAKAGISDDQLAAIVKTAERFSERFGTFTNEENYQNFQNLKVYTTPSMQAWMDGYVHEQQQKFKDQELAFYGVTTKTLVSKVLTSRPDRIEVLVNTERQEITDQSETAKISYQNILIEMQHVDDDWKVNFAQFQGT